MKTTAKFVTEITVTDPDSGGEVELDVFKHENGGMFAIDASYLDQCFDDGEAIIIPDPISNNDMPKEDCMCELTGI